MNIFTNEFENLKSNIQTIKSKISNYNQQIIERILDFNNEYSINKKNNLRDNIINLDLDLNQEIKYFDQNILVINKLIIELKKEILISKNKFTNYSNIISNIKDGTETDQKIISSKKKIISDYYYELSLFKSFKKILNNFKLLEKEKIIINKYNIPPKINLQKNEPKIFQKKTMNNLQKSEPKIFQNIQIPTPPKDHEFIPRNSILFDSKLSFNICNELDQDSCEQNDNIGVLMNNQKVGVFNSKDICKINKQEKCFPKNYNSVIESNFDYDLSEQKKYLTQNIFNKDGNKFKAS
jgi:hypothetical protein